MGKFLGFCILLSFSLRVFALDQPLLFPIEKNNVRPLPLRFEYSLVDENQFQVGDVLMDFRDVKFDVFAGTGKKNLNLRFRWPSGLVQTGEIVLKDTTGKAIWTQKLDGRRMKVITKKPEGEELRAHLGELVFPAAESEIIPKIQFLPFFKFCVNYETSLTKIYLCSKDLYLKRLEKGSKIAERENARSDAFVEINGRPVDPNGIVVLNDPADTVSMRALLRSGATIEMETRMKEIEFVDAYMTDDEKSLVIRARGTEPASTENMRRKNADEWETTLKMERPFLFVKGEGNIPLRQEFLIKGKVRKDKLKVILKDADDDKTYSSSKSFTVVKTSEANLAAGDKLGKISGQTRRSAEWTLNNLTTDNVNKRYLKVSSQNMDYYATHSVTRGRSWQLHTQIEGPLRSQLKLSKWMGLYWMLGLEAVQKMEKTSTIPELSYGGLNLHLRFNRGLQNMDSGWGMILKAGSIKAGSETANVSMAMSQAGLWGQFKFENMWFGLGDWLLLEATTAAPATTVDLSLKSYSSLNIGFRFNLGDSFYWDYGGRFASMRFENDTLIYQSTQSYIYTGLGIFF